MAVINDLIQDIVEYEAHRLANTNPGIEYDDLLQEGLLAMSNDDVKPDQKKAYYKKIAFNCMLAWIKLQKMGGIVINKHGGDRKSPTFKRQQELMNNIHVVSLDGLSVELPDKPILFGKKTNAPDYDTHDYPQSKNDRMTDAFLKGRR